MNKSYGMNVGGSSILMIFVLLCLVTFSTLSLVSANADYQLTAKAAQSVTRYYEADAQAETLLAVIDGKIKNTSENMPNNTNAVEFYQQISDSLLELEGVSATMQGDELIIQYQIEIDDRRALQISLQPVYPFKNAEKRYVLTAWQVIQTAEWEPDDTVTVWDGENSLPLWSGE